MQIFCCLSCVQQNFFFFGLPFFASHPPQKKKDFMLWVLAGTPWGTTWEQRKGQKYSFFTPPAPQKKKHWTRPSPPKK
jgi:hypothetical protein